VYPGAPDAWYDGIDQDCSGGSDYDADGDGALSSAYGGADCDDADPSRRPGATEIWYDGIDQDCSGTSDFDADGDTVLASAYGGTDCDDTRASVRPGAAEVWYDGIDQDCSGGSDYDADGDTFERFPYGLDCNDAVAAIRPGATEIWYDGVDQNCSGGSDYDADRDGDDAEAFGGTDCDDTRATVYLGATEARDGLDNDCDDTCDEGLIAAGDLVISEVMVNPSVSTDPAGEWIELYNATSTDITLCNGWTLADNASGDRPVDPSFRVFIPAGGYATLAYESDPAFNGGLDMDGEYASTLALSNSGDTLNLKFGGLLIDNVVYTSGWPQSAGTSMHLKASRLDATSNNSSANWCFSTSTAANGERATPGAPEPGCP
jgi:hypothetical protein